MSQHHDLLKLWLQTYMAGPHRRAPAGYFPNGTPRGFGHILAPGESERAHQNVVEAQPRRRRVVPVIDLSSPIHRY